MSISVEIPSRPVTTVRPEPATKASCWLHPGIQVSCLVLWSLLLFFYGLHQGDLYRTEGLRAILGMEMYRTGDWLIPRLYGEPILTKPPFFYWAIAATGNIIGEVTTWTARLPAAVAGALSVLMVFFTLRRYFSADQPHAFLAALALPCSMMWLEKASSSEIDTMLVMWVLAAWACFLRVMEYATRNPNDSNRNRQAALKLQQSGLIFWWIAALLCVAGGVLTKWTGFLFFYVMAVPMLVLHRQFWRLFHWHHILAASLGVALVFCWLGPVIHELGWSNVWNMLYKEGAPRVLHGKNASQQLLLETVLHPFKVLGIALPWSLIALFGWWKTQRWVPWFAGTPANHAAMPQQLLTQSLWCWALLGTLMMTLFPDHNIRQSFSLVPAWTLLGCLTLIGWLQAKTLQHPMRWIAIGLLLWTAVKVLHVEVIIPARYAKRPSLSEQARIIKDFVPADATLYLSKVKDECLMFNYGRTTQRLADLSTLTAFGDNWCMMTEQERQATKLIILKEKSLLDAQGDPLFVCQVRYSGFTLPR